MTPRPTAALAALAALLAACGAEDGGTRPARERPGATAQPIVGGAADQTRPEVLLLEDDTLAGFRCTATLIAPNLVITARHCVAKRSTGSTLCRGGATDEGAQSLPNYQGDVEASPMYFTAAPGGPTLARAKSVHDDGATTTCAHDLALIELDRDLLDIAPAQLRRTPVAVGDPLVVMGFGWTDRGATVNASERRVGTTNVLALGPTVLSFKPFGDAAASSEPLAIASGEVGVAGITMTGDSGGPAFDAAGRVAALVSRGYSDAFYGPGTFTSLAAHLATIDAALAATGNGLRPDAGDDKAPTPPAADAGAAGGGTPGPAAEAIAEPSSHDGGGCAMVPARGGVTDAAQAGAGLLFALFWRTRRRARARG